MKFTINRRFWCLPLPFNFVLLLVWDYCGNIYGNKKVIRFDWGPGVWLCELSYVSNCVETYVYMALNRRWLWNSEHMALKYGEHRCHEWPAPAESWVWESGLFGEHVYF